MPDPLEALREPHRPVVPDPLFAAHLRARLARALTLPKGVTVSNAALESPPPDDADQEPGPRMGDVGYVSLWVPDADRAAAFFGGVLGWTYGPSGSGWARQVQGQSVPHGIFGGQDHSTLFLCFVVDDMAAALERVRVAGGTAEEPTREPHGLIAGCIDDQGVRFALVEIPDDGSPGPRSPSNGARNGDVSYITMEVEDSAKTRAFYHSVLGWEFSPGRVDDGWGVVDTVPMTGMHGGNAHATTVPMYRVDDIHDTVARIRARGGTAPEPEQQSYGLTCLCADDQGTRFYLGQH